MAVSTETKVGVFFLVGLIILSVITFKVEDLGSLFRRQTVMRARFSHAAGLKEGDTVAIAGVKKGEIDRIDLTDEGVEVIMQIDADARIKADARAEIAWGGLLGNRYVDITLGTPAAEALPPNALIPTEESVRLSSVLRKIDRAAGQFENLLAEDNVLGKVGKVMDNMADITDKIASGKGTIGKLVNNPELYDSAAEVAADIRDQKGTIGKLIRSDELYTKALAVVDDLKSASARVEKLIAGNDDRIGNILKHLEEAVPEAKDAFTGIKNLAKKVEEGEGVLPALLDDVEMRDNLKNSLAKVSKALDKVEQFATNLQEGKGLAATLVNDETLANDVRGAASSLKAIAERIEKGDNTLARLTRDSDMYDDAKKLVNDIRETLRRVKEQVPVGTFTSVMLSAF